MRAEIINIGTELLLGDTLNTHAQFLSKQLAQYGIDLFFHTTVGDNPERVRLVTELALNRSDIIIFTAGLGPTQDDLTKEIVCESLGVELEFRQDLMEHVESFFIRKNKKMTDNNIKQAYAPQNAFIIDNELGTACGIILKHGEKHIIMIPGPIHEFEHVYFKGVEAYLQALGTEHIYSEKIFVAGVGESAIESQILDLIEAQTQATIATYAKNSYTEIRVTAKSNQIEDCKALVIPLAETIKERFKNNLFIPSNREEQLNYIFDKCQQAGLHLGVAESFTGGKLSDLFTQKSGASALFDVGLVTYSNRMKIQLLDVLQASIDQHTEVSEKVAQEMAEGLVRKYGVDIGISTTGLAGPGNGGLPMPVGTVYFAIATQTETKVYAYALKGTREEIQNQIIDEIIKKLIDLLGSL